MFASKLVSQILKFAIYTLDYYNNFNMLITIFSANLPKNGIFYLFIFNKSKSTLFLFVLTIQF